MFSLIQLSLKIVFLALMYLFLYILVKGIYKDLKAYQTNGPTGRKPSKNPRLVVLESPSVKAGRGFSLAHEFVIGRSPKNNLFLKDVFVSKHHGRIYKRGGKMFIEDLNSSNGIFLNGEKITAPSRIKVGDKVKIGQSTFEFVE